METFKFIFFVSVSVALLLSTTLAFSKYRSKIPNGYRVYDPCSPRKMVYGVGHVDPNGSGKRNPFGDLFASEGYKWDNKTCRADSDGDGLTNGEELGDPYCIWKVGDTPTRKTNITSPGISNKCYSK
ncbi:unnamed protein product [Candidula unifasciata]|uniref:Temptin Cys/Cys disulfide domain-containing protein n=1 Tax=Candidula unifasciata TaxID=100452 RepID=A0A8S3YKY9_9EUPU|nr:unnamed protein product [Candidula unifasciata]